MLARRERNGFTAILMAAAATMIGCSSSYDDDPQAPPAPAPAPPAAGDTLALTSNNRLVTFNRSAPSISTAVSISGLAAGENLLGIDIRPGGTPSGELYALGSTGRVYTINTGTGVATQKSTLTADATDATSPFTALDGTDFGVDFNPVPDRLRIVSNTGQNLRVNVDTGATITDGTLNSAGATRTGITAAAYSNSFASACRTTLFYLDAALNRVVTTTDPNNGVLSDVGALGVNADSMHGFEIVTATDGSNSAFAVLSVNNAPTLNSINLATGAATSAGAVTGLNPGETIRGLAIAPPTNSPAQATGEVLGVSESNKLVSFNSAAPQKLCTSATITGAQSGENILGIDARPADGAVYALGSSGRVYTLNVATAAAMLKSTLAADAADTSNPFTALDGAEFGVDFNPVPDRLRVVSNTGQNLRINVDTGATTTDAAVNPAGFTVSGAAYTNSFAGAGTTTLHGIDVANDRLVIQGQPSGNPNNGDLAAVGALGANGDVQSVGGFDINGRNSSAFAALNLAGAATSELHMINLATGASTRVNTIGGGERVRGLTLAAVARATVVGVTADNRVVTFKTATPGTFDTNVAIAGLQGGENVLGIDFRPATGRLYALTDGGRLYTVDPITGGATVAPILVADAADTSDPFGALAGTAFGTDFNPVVDRLRTVSDAEQNLRTNVDSGATITDVALNRAPFNVTAAAYANNFAGTAATTLYAIDTRNDRLLVQNPPNNGTLNDIGALGVDIDAVTGFEIVGPDTALAALSNAATPAGLYSVNLASGAATFIGAVAVSQATDRITGLSAMPSSMTPAANSLVFATINGTALVSFARNAPATVSAPLPISYLQPGETLLGIDFRPATGALYGLGSTGRVYTIDTATGAATLAATLVADGTDTTDPFNALNGSDFGVDFNPVPDRLRVVSNTGQNLRINVDTGATTTDGSLNVATPDAIAAAYTRNFAGTATTTLLVIDAATATLQLQNPPNNGTLATIGRLDPMQTFTGIGGFDIAGGDDGLALALLQPAGAAQSTLYRVNLRTGAATVIGVVGPAGTALIRGVAIQLQ
jgi:hypothetical protein